MPQSHTGELGFPNPIREEALISQEWARGGLTSRLKFASMKPVMHWLINAITTHSHLQQAFTCHLPSTIIYKLCNKAFFFNTFLCHDFGGAQHTPFPVPRRKRKLPNSLPLWLQCFSGSFWLICVICVAGFQVNHVGLLTALGDTESTLLLFLMFPGRNPSPCPAAETSSSHLEDTRSNKFAMRRWT